MFKKRFIGLVPLLATAALAVMPVAGQAATQHWYKSGIIAMAGEEVPVVTFGEEGNLSSTNGALEFNCRTVGGGTIENPVGGGAGVGRTNSLNFYECKAQKCEQEVLAKFGVPGRWTITSENNPAATKEPAFPGWTGALEESTVAGTSSIREKIGEPFVTFTTPAPSGMIRETDACIVSSTGQMALVAIAEGELKPEIGAAKIGNLNGNGASKPSKVVFDKAGTGALESAEVGPEPWEGQLKYLGYNEQELITVKP
jgi:hypothetical protein